MEPVLAANLFVKSLQEVICEENKDRPILREPYKITTPPERRDKNRFCLFHKEHAHTISECHNLHNQIQALIRSGRLTQYINGSSRFGVSQPNTTSAPTPPMADSLNVASTSSQEPLKQIPMIHGIMEITTEQERATKNRKRMEERVKRYRSLGHTVNLVALEDKCYPSFAITFTEDDLRGLHLSHDNPLVISLQFDHCQLRRVLVDGGN
ncbi:uncharacterized protein LOC133815662 [Humulus lupulus]|uniref:uncharacterized protein LOC133815662 n=1 Tax=Humulus lupulus TaxID=3486 RepID=UPI002B40D9E3|nr:uncharacterized protein LOC133815662 [Humulus lupulus]